MFMDKMIPVTVFIVNYFFPCSVAGFSDSAHGLSSPSKNPYSICATSRTMVKNINISIRFFRCRDNFRLIVTAFFTFNIEFLAIEVYFGTEPTSNHPKNTHDNNKNKGSKETL